MIQKVRKPQNWKAPFTHTQTHKHRHTCTNCTQKKTQHGIHTGVVYMPSCDTVKVLQLQGDIPDSFPLVNAVMNTAWLSLNALQ